MISGWNLDQQNTEENNLRNAIVQFNHDASILHNSMTQGLNNQLALLGNWIKDNQSHISHHLIESIYNLYQAKILPYRPSASSYTPGWLQDDKILIADLTAINNVLENPTEENIAQLYARSEKPRLNMYADTSHSWVQALGWSSMALLIVGAATVTFAPLAFTLLLPVGITLGIIGAGIGVAGFIIQGCDSQLSSTSSIAFKGTHNRMFTLFEALDKKENSQEDGSLLNYRLA